MRGGLSVWLLIGGLVLCGACSDSADTPVSVVELPLVNVAFTDVTGESGLPDGGLVCLVFRDLNGDERPDLLLAPTDEEGQFGGDLSIYWNSGDGSFERQDLGLQLNYVSHCAAGDLNGDNVVDLLIVAQEEEMQLMVLEGERMPSGDFRFEPHGDIVIPDAYRLALVDYDVDGLDDIIVGTSGSGMESWIERCDLSDSDYQCYLDAGYPFVGDVVYRNLGGLQFEATLTLPTPGNTMALAVLDVDFDGFPDVFQSSDFGSNALYRNDAGGGFHDLLEGWSANPHNHGMGVAFADFDLDGTLDFYVADLGPDQFFFSDGNGGYIDRASTLGIVDPTRYHSGWDPSAGDFNNDGYPDVFVVNSIVADSLETFVGPGGWSDRTLEKQPNDFVFLNRGGQGLKLVHVPHRTTTASIRDGASAVADYDGDGRLDIAVLVDYSVSEFRLLRNVSELPAHHWLQVRPVHRDGRPAMGVMVVLDPDSTTISQRIPVGTSDVGYSELVAHFGLGTREQASGLTVYWPGGGVQYVAGPIAADQVLVVREE